MKNGQRGVQKGNLQFSQNSSTEDQLSPWNTVKAERGVVTPLCLVLYVSGVAAD